MRIAWFGSSVGLLGDVNRLASGMGVSTSDATMARKDLRLMLEEAARHGTELRVVPGGVAMLDEAIA